MLKTLVWERKQHTGDTSGAGAGAPGQDGRSDQEKRADSSRS